MRGIRAPLQIHEAEPYQMTNKGLRIQLLLSKKIRSDERHASRYAAILDNDNPDNPIGTYLEKLSDREYARVDSGILCTEETDHSAKSFKSTAIYIRNSF